MRGKSCQVDRLFALQITLKILPDHSTFTIIGEIDISSLVSPSRETEGMALEVPPTVATSLVASKLPYTITVLLRYFFADETCIYLGKEDR